VKSCAFDYERPRDIAEAISLLAKENSKAVAGSQSLGPMLNLRIVQPAVLVDLRHLEELKDFFEDRESVTLGACVTHARIEDGKVPDPTRGFMRAVAGNIAYRAVRNRGTIGGSLVHADPAADWPAVFLALDGEAVVTGARGERTIPASQFFTAMLQSAVKRDEVLSEVRLSVERKRAGTAYVKLRQSASGFAIVGVAAQVSLDRRGRIEDSGKVLQAHDTLRWNCEPP